MKTYKVKIKNGNKAETIKAKTELGAKVLYCNKKGFNYRYLASKLEVLDKTSQSRRDK